MRVVRRGGGVGGIWCGLAPVGIAYQPDRGEQLKLQPQDRFLSGLTRLILARRLVGAGGKVLVPASAAAAVRHDHALVGLGKIVDLLAGPFVIHDCSHGDFQHHAFAVATAAVGAFAGASALSFVFGIETEVDQRIVALARFHDHVAPATAVAARRAAARDELLPAKSHAAVAAVSGFDADYRFIDKHL